MPESLNNDIGTGFKLDIAQWRGETTQAIKDIKEDMASVKTDVRATTKELQAIHAKIDTVIRELIERISLQEKELAEKEILYVDKFTRGIGNIQTLIETKLHEYSSLIEEEFSLYKKDINKKLAELEINYISESSKNNITRGIIISIATAIFVLVVQVVIKHFFSGQ